MLDWWGLDDLLLGLLGRTHRNTHSLKEFAYLAWGQESQKLPRCPVLTVKFKNKQLKLH